MLTNKQKVQLANRQHLAWLRSLGLKFDKNGRIISRYKGYDMPDYKVKNSIPTSNRIVGNTYKKTYATQLPIGKTISVAYNKGPYMIVDAKDFKSMGKRI